MLCNPSLLFAMKTFIVLSFLLCVSLALALQPAGQEDPFNAPTGESEAQDGLECILCTTLVEYVETEIENNQTETEILTDLVNFCKQLPYGQEDCEVVVSEYGKVIIAMVIDEANATVVCSAIGLCSNSSSLFEFIPSSRAGLTSICKVLVNEGLDVLAQQQLTNEIKQVILQSPAWLKYEAVVARYGASIMQIIENEQNALACQDTSMG